MAAPFRGALRYLLTATRWSVLAGASTLVAGGVAVVARAPGTLWPVHGAVIGLIVGAAAIAADERCAIVVDVAPRPLWWRTAVRSVTPAMLVVVWALAHRVVRNQLPDHLGVLVLQGMIAAALGFGLATAARATGRAEPGAVLATTAVPLLVAGALARPFEADLPLFPVWPHEDWDRALAIWGALGASAVLITAAALSYDARPRRTIRPTGRSQP